MGVKAAIEYQDRHALRLGADLRRGLDAKRPTKSEASRTARLAIAFAGRADRAAGIVAWTSASTTIGEAGKAAWVHSVKVLGDLYRHVAGEYIDLADGRQAAAGRLALIVLAEQKTVTRLAITAERDLGLPKND